MNNNSTIDQKNDSINHSGKHNSNNNEYNSSHDDHPIKNNQIKQSNQILEKLVVSFKKPEFLEDAVIKTFLEPVDVPQNKYSRTNKILLALQDAFDARGNGAWRELNRFPKDWTQKVYIMMPKTRKISDKDDEEEKFITTGFFIKGLYNVENTYGTSSESEIQYVKNHPKQFPPLYNVAKKWGIKIQYRVNPTAWGSYDPDKNTIQLSTEDSATFFHELAHKGHELIDGKLKSGQDPQQEAIAQLCAGVLARMHNQKMDLDTYKYIKSYATEDPKKTLQLINKVLDKTGKVLELILETAEKSNK